MNTTPTNTADLRAALIEARDWFEGQAKAVSKGCGSSYELHDLRVQRDALDAALAAPAQASASERAAFERWQGDVKGLDLQKLSMNADGDYDWCGIQNEWEAWQYRSALATPAQPLHLAATSCPHEIDKDKIVLHFDSKQPGKNALAQLAARLQAAQAQEDARQLLTDAEVSSVYFEVLGTVRIQDPTLINRLVRAIEAAHGIK